MLNKRPADVQQADDREDARVERSVSALRQAMAALLAEGAFADLTVQHIIERAGVSRATFYAHFRNKDDVLFASFERMFGGLEAHMDRGPASRPRLLPVAELLTHFSDSAAVFDSLRASDRLEAIWNLGTDFMADMIERRLPLVTTTLPSEPRLMARMLAGAAVELIKWWLDHPGQLTAQQLDTQFHDMAHRLVATRGVARP